MSRKKPKTRNRAKAHPKGIFESNPRGFGFVKTAEGDFFIPAKYASSAFDGDEVEIAPLSKHAKKQTHNYRGKQRPDRDSRRSEARVVKVLERAHAYIVGRYEIAGPFGIVVPDDRRINHDIFTRRRDNPDVHDGDIVKVEILEYPTRRSSATGRVVEVIGKEGDSGLVIERIISRYDLQTSFREKTLQEADGKSLDIEAALLSGYRDITDRFIFTIDPADAKDFDDAISIDGISPDEFSRLDLFNAVRLPRLDGKDDPGEANSPKRGKIASRKAQGEDGIYRLGVHIADVSFYVGWGSSIDLDARGRATSVYLADRVIPMLPEALSNDLCSLKPGCERLSFVCDIYIDGNANLIAYDLYPGVMKSRRRLSYDEAQEMIDGAQKGHPAKEPELASKLALASKIAKKRASIRRTLGGIEFDTREAKVHLDEDGTPIAIDVRAKNDATELIEEAMIFANEVVATHLSAHSEPCAYRVHEKPPADALAQNIAILQEFPWFKDENINGIKAGNPHSIQNVLDACANRPEADMITMLFLRSMTRALYSPVNVGHYGLGLKAYCHFTSPIRRYPDLMVHRFLRASLVGREERHDQMTSMLKWICEHASEAERVAENASYDSQRVKIAQYMEQFIGTSFSAVISGVTNYGLYVRLENCAEGLVPIRTIGDEYFSYDEAKQMLVGSETLATYRLGQKLAVVLTKCDIDSGKLDFAIKSPG